MAKCPSLAHSIHYHHHHHHHHRHWPQISQQPYWLTDGERTAADAVLKPGGGKEKNKLEVDATIMKANNLETAFKTSFVLKNMNLDKLKATTLGATTKSEAKDSTWGGFKDVATSKVAAAMAVAKKTKIEKILDKSKKQAGANGGSATMFA